MAKSDFDAFCRTAFTFLEATRTRYLVVGGLAVVAVGEPRITGDVDVVAFLTPADAERLITEASTAGFELQRDVELERLRRTGTLRFRLGLFQLDIILA